MWGLDQRWELARGLLPSERGHGLRAIAHRHDDSEFFAQADEPAKVARASRAVRIADLTLVTEVVRGGVPPDADTWIDVRRRKRLSLTDGRLIAIEVRVQDARLIRAAGCGRAWVPEQE